MAEFLRIYEDNPQERLLDQVVKVLKKGGIIIYPTDTVYGMGCDLTNKKAVQRLCLIKGVKPQHLNLSFICADLSDLSYYAKRVDNTVFKLMRNTLPGPYTFILESSSEVPKILDQKKTQVGIRVPNNSICQELVKRLGNPIINASIKDDDALVEYTTDPSLIRDRFDKLVDLVIDAGPGGNVASTVIDCTVSPPEVIREGLGSIAQL